MLAINYILHMIIMKNHTLFLNKKECLRFKDAYDLKMKLKYTLLIFL